MSYIWLKTIVAPMKLMLLHNQLIQLVKKLRLWFKMGVETKNTLRYFSVNQIYPSLIQLVSSALPAFYALLGCDYTAAFFRKGKARPFECLEKSQEVQCTFSNLAWRATKHIRYWNIYLCTIWEKDNWIPSVMQSFKFFAINTERKMKISR